MKTVQSTGAPRGVPAPVQLSNHWAVQSIKAILRKPRLDQLSSLAPKSVAGHGLRAAARPPRAGRGRGAGARPRLRRRRRDAPAARALLLARPLRRGRGRGRGRRRKERRGPRAGARRLLLRAGDRRRRLRPGRPGGAQGDRRAVRREDHLQEGAAAEEGRAARLAARAGRPGADRAAPLRRAPAGLLPDAVPLLPGHGLPPGRRALRNSAGARRVLRGNLELLRGRGHAGPRAPPRLRRDPPRPQAREPAAGRPRALRRAGPRGDRPAALRPGRRPADPGPARR